MTLQLSKDMDRLSILSKTPVSWLHEVCTRNNVTPKYDLLQVEGAIHEPIFQYRLTLEYNGKIYEESGTGRSKKEAKHNTARAMLRSMEVVAPHELFELGEVTALPAIEAGDGSGDLLDGDSGANPVGILQELCMKMKYPPPTYEVDSEEGLPHERLFAIACRVGEQFVEIGKGKSKKLAKRVSAHNMAERLRSLPMETSNSRVYQDDDDIIIERIRALGLPEKKSKKSNRKKNKSGSSVRSSGEASCQAYEYKNMTGEVADLLRDPNHVLADNEVVPFVRRLGKEQNFKAMYLDSDELSASGEYQCMAQLTLEPPLVLIGEAATKAQAKRAAAFDVVNFFKQMVRVQRKNKADDSKKVQPEPIDTENQPELIKAQPESDNAQPESITAAE